MNEPAPSSPERLPVIGVGDQGLSTAQVEAQRAHGFNDIVAEPSGGWRLVARDTARDPMLWFLVLTAGLFGLLGQIGESVTLLVAIAPLLGMDAYLHRRTLASTAGLASRLASTARVVRDGQWASIPSRELVPGDLVEVLPGQYFPADGLLVSGSGLQTDESALTGESLPVRKAALCGAEPVTARVPELCWGIAGTRLLTGTARLRVVHIGAETRYGEITRSAAEGSHAITPLQKAIGGLVSALLVAALLACLILAAVRLWQGYGWIDAVLSAVTLAVAALPEEFPVVYTFFLGLGVFRLARKRALVRRAVAVENIGRITCIVSDKTGTITAGALVLAHRLPAAGHDDESLLRVATFAARSDSGDPLDEALHAAAGQMPAATRLADFPFTEARRRETTLWRTAAHHAIAFTKGAPETVLACCSMPADEVARWHRQVEELAGSGHKVIACALRELRDEVETTHEPDAGFTFSGLLAFEDPVRNGVGAAIADCMAAGMRVIMVTGDHPATAVAIAREIGLGGPQPRVAVLSPGDDPAAVLTAAGDVDVVARATPPQKLALVQALQAEGEIVAVTGDGVNDVPALRVADVGIAMGERGTRSAREVAPVVLLDDNFRTIVDAVAEGRQLFENLRLAFAYLLLVHLPLVVGAAVIPLMGMPLLFLPIHIVWLELVIHPTAMLAFQDLPARGPLAPVERHQRARFFSPGAWAGIGLVGGLVCVAVVWSYHQALGADRDVEHARAMALTALLLASAAITAGLTRLRNAAARWVVLGTLGSVGLFVQSPVVSGLLHLRPLHSPDWAIAIAISLGTAIATNWLSSRLWHPPQAAARRTM